MDLISVDGWSDGKCIMLKSVVCLYQRLSVPVCDVSSECSSV